MIVEGFYGFGEDVVVENYCCVVVRGVSFVDCVYER